MNKEPREIFYCKRNEELVIGITYNDFSKEAIVYQNIKGQWEPIIQKGRIDVLKFRYLELQREAKSTGKELEPRNEYVEKWKESYIKRANEIYQKYRVKISVNGLDKKLRKLL